MAKSRAFGVARKSKKDMKTKKIWDYFDNNIEYPHDVAENPIPYGDVWTYISSTFLNGFVNYMTPICCYVVNRYTREDEDISDRNVSVCNKGKFGNWEKFKGTKKELIDLIVSGEKEMYHTELNCFHDDIIIVGEIGEGKYMFFWFDCDVSDCSIGRFKTLDTKEEIIASVENWLEEEFVSNKDHEEVHDENSAGYHKLPLSFIRGWVSF